MKIKLLYILFILPLLLCGCSSSYFYSTINSRGYTPENKSYYITSPDVSLAHSLEFLEYAEILKQRLNEVGYCETNQDEASLTIYLDYSLGEPYLADSSTKSTTYSTASVYTNASSSTNRNSSATANSRGNSRNVNATTNTSNNGSTRTTGYSTSGTTTTTTHRYKIPVIVSIQAVSNENLNPVWEVIINDYVYRESQLQTVMPWLLLCAQQYFGMSSNGEAFPRIDNKKSIREKYNLIWPY